MDNPTEIKAACGDIIAAFAHHVDHREFGDAVALFAEDGAFLRPDLEARGRDQIAALWADRPASFVTKHLCHASFFQDVGEESARAVTPRSEEHTSELQSLMRISYADYCLQKKTHTDKT